MNTNKLPPGVIKTLMMNKMKGIDSSEKEVYLETYFASLSEANKLLKESELLFDNNSFERAYFLAFSALEEISKSQLAADVFTGLIEESKFKKAYRNHTKKIERVEWIKIDGNSYPFFEFDKVYIEDFDLNKKMKSMYVDIRFEENKISTPGDIIEKKDAQSIINAVKIGLYRIYEITVEEGEQIGTKGFMK